MEANSRRRSSRRSGESAFFMALDMYGTGKQDESMRLFDSAENHNGVKEKLPSTTLKRGVKKSAIEQRPKVTLKKKHVQDTAVNKPSGPGAKKARKAADSTPEDSEQEKEMGTEAMLTFQQIMHMVAPRVEADVKRPSIPVAEAVVVTPSSATPVSKVLTPRMEPDEVEEREFAAVSGGQTRVEADVKRPSIPVAEAVMVKPSSASPVSKVLTPRVELDKVEERKIAAASGGQATRGQEVDQGIRQQHLYTLVRTTLSMLAAHEKMVLRDELEEALAQSGSDIAFEQAEVNAILEDIEKTGEFLLSDDGKFIIRI